MKFRNHGRSPSYKHRLDSDVDIPRVHFYHGSGTGHLEHGFVTPKISDRGQPDDFLLIPVETIEDVQVSIAGDEDTASTLSSSGNESYDNCLRKTKYVAIARKRQDEKAKLDYISCRRQAPLWGSSMAEYRNKLGGFEVFEKFYSSETDTFSFKSHNGLYLHFNERFKVATFKSLSSDLALWTVRQRAPGSVLYLGLLDLAGPSIIAESTSKKLNRDDFNYTIAILRGCEEIQSPNKSAIFTLPDIKQRWVIQTGEDGITAISITSLDYPLYMAVESCDYSASIFEVRRKSFLKNSRKISESDCRKLNEKLLASRVYCEEFPLHKLSEQERELVEKMQDNIKAIMENKVSGEELMEKSGELLEQAKIFKKQAKDLKSSMSKKLWLGAGMATGAIAGGLVGWLAGGPAGAAWLGTQTAEIGTGIACGVGAAAGAAYLESKAEFWAKDFVQIQVPGTKLLRRQKSEGCALKT